jgi:hypothetical protein
MGWREAERQPHKKSQPRGIGRGRNDWGSLKSLVRPLKVIQ